MNVIEAIFKQSGGKNSHRWSTNMSRLFVLFIIVLNFEANADSESENNNSEAKSVGVEEQGDPEENAVNSTEPVEISLV